MNFTTWLPNSETAADYRNGVYNMDNFAEKKNGEGYSDPTPYQAIQNMIKPGEIWTYMKKDNTETEVLVIAFSDNIATILFLMDEYKDGCIECVSKTVKWTNPRMMNWAWGGYLHKCVRKLSIQEFNQIGLELEKVLAVKIGKEADCMANPDPAASRELMDMKAELDAVRCYAQEADCMAEKYAKACDLAKNKANKMEIQLALMKEMYADLMNKFLQKV